MSFWKQDPPKPTEALRNFGPIRESVPMARATSFTYAPVRSHNLEMELMLLTRWANIALATNFDSSELLGADTMGTGEPLRGKNFPVTLRVVECTCQDSRGWWSGFDPLGPSWHRHRPAPELHPGRWAVGRQHPSGLLCTNLFTTCHVSKPLQSKCSAHRKFEAICCCPASPQIAIIKAKFRIWRRSVVAGTNHNECPSKPVHVALQVLICPFVAGNEQGHQDWFNRS